MRYEYYKSIYRLYIIMDYHVSPMLARACAVTFIAMFKEQREKMPKQLRGAIRRYIHLISYYCQSEYSNQSKRARPTHTPSCDDYIVTEYTLSTRARILERESEHKVASPTVRKTRDRWLLFIHARVMKYSRESKTLQASRL